MFYIIIKFNCKNKKKILCKRIIRLFIIIEFITIVIFAIINNYCYYLKY
jgi:hypothetical protein